MDHLSSKPRLIEMFRHERSRWTRLVRFSADCPLCGSNIELRQGKPDHTLPLVGRCIESPHAHGHHLPGLFILGYDTSFLNISSAMRLASSCLSALMSGSSTPSSPAT